MNGADLRIGEEVFSVDEPPRPDATLAALAKLPSIFKKNGTVTAGSASVRGLATRGRGGGTAFAACDSVFVSRANNDYRVGRKWPGGRFTNSRIDVGQS